MSDHIDRAAEVIADTTPHSVPGYRRRYAEASARALDEAGLLVIDEHERMEQRFAEFLHEQTGGLLSKTGYDVRTMVQAADDYYQQCYEEDQAARDAEVRAEELELAAHELEGDTHVPDHALGRAAIQYLRDRADRIRGGGDD